MTRPRTDEPDCEHLTDLDRLASGDPSPELWARIEAHVPTCAQCADALAFFVEERLDAEPIQPPSAPVIALPKRRSWLMPLALAASLLLAAGVAVIVAQRAPVTTLTAKGDPDAPPADALYVVRVRADGIPERLEPGDLVNEGDRLSLFYSIGRDAYVLVFSVDREAPPTLIFPIDAAPRSMSAGLEQPLDVGARVGPPPARRKEVACEWLVAVFADTPLDLATVQRHLSAPPSDGCAFSPTVPGARQVVVFPARR